MRKKKTVKCSVWVVTPQAIALGEVTEYRYEFVAGSGLSKVELSDLVRMYGAGVLFAEGLTLEDCVKVMYYLEGELIETWDSADATEEDEDDGYWYSR